MRESWLGQRGGPQIVACLESTPQHCCCSPSLSPGRCRAQAAASAAAGAAAAAKAQTLPELRRERHLLREKGGRERRASDGSVCVLLLHLRAGRVSLLPPHQQGPRSGPGALPINALDVSNTPRWEAWTVRHSWEAESAQHCSAPPHAAACCCVLLLPTRRCCCCMCVGAPPALEPSHPPMGHPGTHLGC